MRLLVLGDSLSDGGWERDRDRIGSAWPAALLRLARSRGVDLEIVNRARGGSRSSDVLEFAKGFDGWKAFDAVAVLVGANDLWRRWVPWNSHDPVDPDDYARNLSRIVRLGLDGGARAFWILSPCLLHPDPDHAWNLEMAEYRDAGRRVSRDAGQVYLPVGEEFEGAVRAHPEVRWTYDGAHPRPVGHERIAWTVYHHAMDGEAIPCDALPARPSDAHPGRWP